MKYTDRFFEFPVRIYDRFTAERAETLEKTNEVPAEGDWAAGMTRLSYREITNWSDYFDSVQGVDGVKEEGFKYTLVFTEHEGAFICTWDRAKFERKLSEFVEKLEKWREEEAKKLTVYTLTSTNQAQLPTPENKLQ